MGLWIGFQGPSTGRHVGLPTAIFLGAFAAGISIYVLTNTDTSAFARTLFFAALCGFAWKPACDAGIAFIEHRQDAAVAESGNKVLELAKSLSNTSTPAALLPTKLEEIHDSAIAALESLPEVNSPKVRRDVETKVNAALRIVVQVAPQHPQITSHLLQSVGETAAKNQSPKVANEALTSLEKLAETTTNRTFALSHTQLKTNIASTVSARYRLNSVIRPQ